MENVFLTSLTTPEVKELFRNELVKFFAENGNPQQPAKEISKPINQDQLAKFLGVTTPTIIRWRQKGAIPFIKIGSAIRYDVNHVVEVLTILNKGKKLR